jgi:2-polyprenyl-3-methyl-5-hydroxy-6-metoxy-1,4-benzoquinol methylase
VEHVPCNLCGADDYLVRYPSTISAINGRPSDPEHYLCTTLSYGEHFQIVECRQCGLVYATPRRKPADILDDYESVVDTRYLDEQAARVTTFSRNIRPLEKLLGHDADPRTGRQRAGDRRGTNGAHRLLDVGAHVGVFVEVACARGWEAAGLEPSLWAVEQGRSRGLTMYEGTLRDAELDAASYDAVTMWDVVEHLIDPMGDLIEAARVLKPGGALLLHTINVDSAFARLMGKRWPWLVEMHNYFFSPTTLGAMVEKAGLEVHSSHIQGRYLHLGYLLSRLSGFNATLGQWAEGAAKALGAEHWLVPINTGDLFTMLAKKPGGLGN